MEYVSFAIQDFRGIGNVELDLSKAPKSNAYTLVGLNESGKTTILEAIHLFSSTYKSEDLDPLNLPGYAISDIHDCIPASKKTNFNGEIRIKAKLVLDDDDKEYIVKELLNQTNFSLNQAPSEVEIVQRYTFKDSKFQVRKSTWTIQLLGKSKGARKMKDLGSKDPEWPDALQIIRSRFPTVLYFPNFLFEFPDRIYLDEVEADEKTHNFYRTIVQDVLDSLQDQLNLQTHIIDRARSTAKSDRDSLDATLTKMGASISKAVFERWDSIFKKNGSNREIRVNCHTDENQKLFLELRLKEGDEVYEISQRSMGFRWFLAYLLLTHYRAFRGGRKHSVLFLLDEPASNLHSSAQVQLLDSFGELPDNCRLIYSTHSHHMINPHWLEGAFVVKNEGIRYDKGDEDYSARTKSEITVERYRSFAAKHPDQTTYFQPILDVLDYRPNNLELVPAAIFVEGKNDYYGLRLALNQIGGNLSQLSLIPGNGASGLDTLITLYAGWGRSFVVLLDSDQEGAKQKERYEEKFGPLVAGRLFTYDEIDPALTEKTFEELFPEDEALRIQKNVFPDCAVLKKNLFCKALQEKLLENERNLYSSDTLKLIEKVLSLLKARLDGQAIQV